MSQRRVSIGDDHSFKVRELEEKLQKSEKEATEMTENHTVKVKELQILLREKEEDLARAERQHERKFKEKDEELKKANKGVEEAREKQVGDTKTCQRLGRTLALPPYTA